jgi:hypothetical protein
MKISEKSFVTKARISTSPTVSDGLRRFKVLQISELEIGSMIKIPRSVM